MYLRDQILMKKTLHETATDNNFYLKENWQVKPRTVNDVMLVQNFRYENSE